jgi:hypothetical protein
MSFTHHIHKASRDNLFAIRFRAIGLCLRSLLGAAGVVLIAFLVRRDTLLVLLVQSVGSVSLLLVSKKDNNHHLAAVKDDFCLISV